MWRPIPGTEGAYSASDAGEIRRDLAGRGTQAGRVLSPLVRSQDGYRQVKIHLHGRAVTRRVSVLVCSAFHGPRPAGLLVRHLNGISGDDRADNLAWGTSAENAADTLRHGHHEGARKTHCKRGHKLPPDRRCRPCAALRSRMSRARSKVVNQQTVAPATESE